MDCRNAPSASIDGAGTRSIRPVILMYHRIGSSNRGDPWDMTVNPTNFESQMGQIAETRTPLALSEFAARFNSGTLPDNAVAVTFDDAYVDNLSVGKPILDRHSIPATIFVAPGFLGQGPFWWDRLQAIVWSSPHIPESLELDIGGRRTCFLFGAAERRGQALSALWGAVRDLDPPVREDALGGLRNALGTSDDSVDFRPMTRDELMAMAAGEVEIGAHTVNHVWLPALKGDAKRREIQDSLALCRALAGYAPRCFSYPYGAFDPESREIVRQAGFVAACSVTNAAIRPDSDALALPRIAATNDMQLFQRSMANGL